MYYYARYHSPDKYKFPITQLIYFFIYKYVVYIVRYYLKTLNVYLTIWNTTYITFRREYQEKAPHHSSLSSTAR